MNVLGFALRSFPHPTHVWVWHPSSNFKINPWNSFLLCCSVIEQKYQFQSNNKECVKIIIIIIIIVRKNVSIQVYKSHVCFEASTECMTRTENTLKVSNERPELSRVKGKQTCIKKSTFILEVRPFVAEKGSIFFKRRVDTHISPVIPDSQQRQR